MDALRRMPRSAPRAPALAAALALLLAAGVGCRGPRLPGAAPAAEDPAAAQAAARGPLVIHRPLVAIGEDESTPPGRAPALEAAGTPPAPPPPAADTPPAWPPAAQPDGTPTGETSADETPTGEAPADEAPADKAPAGEAPAKGGAAGKPEKCPPLRVGPEAGKPLDEPWPAHHPTYYKGCGPEGKTPCRSPCGPDPRISDTYIRPDPCNVPTRPAPLLELGDPFMSPGHISPGICLPTSQVIQPRLLMYGTYRTALQTFHRDTTPRNRTEWVNRLDLFFNVQISPTERVLIGFRPLSDAANFTGYEFEPSDSWVDGTNLKATTLYFEGDVGEIFPRLSPSDFRPTDLGFSVGRQPIFTQGGVMINDDLDSVGLTRNAWRPTDTSNVLVSGLLAWGNIDRGVNSLRDKGSLLVTLHNEIDTTPTFIELDAAGVSSGSRSLGDAAFFGVGATQRFGKLNTVFRVNQSIALDHTTIATGTGTLLTAELSTTPAATDDNLYLNAFGAFGQYDSASRRPESGGPLGIIGVQFASAGLGRASAPINPRAKDAVGGALGYQRFFCEDRSNLILELAGRASTTGPDTGVISGALRYQRAVGHHAVLTAMAFAGWLSGSDAATYGARLELLLKF